MDKELASTSAQKIFARNNISVSVESTTDFSMEPAGSVDSAGMGANVKAVSDVILGTGLSGSKAFGMSTWNICDSGLKNFSGSMIHTKILDVGKFFGVKFKPWETVGLAKNLAGIGSMFVNIGAGLALFGAGMILIAVGAIGTVAGIRLCIIVFPGMIRGIVWILRKPFHRKAMA